MIILIRICIWWPYFILKHIKNCKSPSDFNGLSGWKLRNKVGLVGNSNVFLAKEACAIPSEMTQPLNVLQLA